MKSRILRIVVITGIVFPFIAIPEVASPAPTYARVWAALLWALCLTPSLIYVFQHPHARQPVPFIQIIGLEFGLYYALPGVFWGGETAGTRTFVGPIDHLPLTIKLVLLGFLALILAYWAATTLLRSEQVENPKREWIPSIQSMRQWGLFLLLVGTTAKALPLLANVPGALERVLIFGYRLSYAGAGFLIFLAARGNLKRRHQAILGICITILLLIQLSSGHVASFLHLSVGLLLPVWVAKRRLTIRLALVSVIVIVCAVALRGVIGQYRTLTERKALAVSEKIEIVYSLVGRRIDQTGVLGTLSEGGDAVVKRSAFLAILADVMRQTPRQVPYWKGDTYYSLITKPIPRAIWPSKPETITGQTFGHRYGYLNPQDHTTSWNMPYLIEMYANFGYYGVVLGMFLVGLIFAYMSSLFNTDTVTRALVGLTIFVPLFNIESSASLVFGSLILDGMALWVVVGVIQIRPYPFGTPENTRRVAHSEGSQAPNWHPSVGS